MINFITYIFIILMVICGVSGTVHPISVNVASVVDLVVLIFQAF
jgi:hypothetical protein